MILKVNTTATNEQRRMGRDAREPGGDELANIAAVLEVGSE
jgi:hypothetical protein